MIPRSARVRGLAAALGACIGAIAACRMEERVVGYKPFFQGLEGASGPGLGAADAAPMGREPPVDPESLRPYVTNPDGSRRLLIRNARELLYHLRTVLREGDSRTFFEQVLSEATRREFQERGLGAAEAWEMLQAQEAEVLRLLSRLPMGEHTPDVVVENLGEGVQRVRLTRAAAKGLALVGFDMVLERGRFMRVDGSGQARGRAPPAYRWEAGQWRLRWFVPGEDPGG